jgi:tRNA pseudouridine55 synthase
MQRAHEDPTGVLVIDKAIGPTSHDVVSAVRSLLGVHKVGHTGTLDPAATGVLPLVLGKATKVASFLAGGKKGYRATVRLGQNTDTLDGEGKVLRERPVHCDEAAVRDVLQRFLGDIQQTPPMYSAKKIDGKRLYEFARKGVEVERAPKAVRIDAIAMLSFASPDVEIDVTCSAGTYLRALAEDIGEALGCGGYLYGLRRTFVGPFGLDSAITLEALRDDPGLAESRLMSVAAALVEMPRISMPQRLGNAIVNGHQLLVSDLRRLDTPTFAADQTLALAVDGGDVFAVARSLLASEELSLSRMARRALKTERVLR